MILILATVLLLLTVAAFFSLAETALTTVSKPMMHQMAQDGAWKPSNVYVFLGFALTYAYFLWAGFPYNNTNQTLVFFVCLSVLGAAARSMLRARTHRITGATLFRELAPLLQLCIVGLYFWTIFHKLNVDFVDSEVSCARRLSTKLVVAFGGEALPESLAPAAVFLTLLTEAALPIGLLFRRTQVPTALAGLGFHWVLGVAGFYGFSVTMIALLTLFLAPMAARAFANQESPRTVWLNRGALLAYILPLYALKRAFGISPSMLTYYLFFALPLIVGALYYLNRGPLAWSEPRFTIRTALAHPTPLYVVPLLLFLNGASPYLGWKTEYSYAMYSNLRTEGGRTNHLIWPAPLSLSGYQTDLVRVMPGSDPALEEAFGGRPLPRYELTREVWKLAQEGKRSNIALVLEDGGATRSFAAAEKEPSLAVEPSYLEAKFLRFRRIVPAEPGKCEH
jgi:hypothetical protein